MYYTAEVVLNDETKIGSEIIEVMVEEKGKAIFYPNPIVDPSVNVLSDGDGQTLTVFDGQGKMMMRVELTLFIETVDITNLSAGLYLFQLEREGKVVHTGRFVKL